MQLIPHICAHYVYDIVNFKILNTHCIHKTFFAKLNMSKRSQISRCMLGKPKCCLNTKKVVNERSYSLCTFLFHIVVSKASCEDILYDVH